MPNSLIFDNVEELTKALLDLHYFHRIIVTAFLQLLNRHFLFPVLLLNDAKGFDWLFDSKIIYTGNIEMFRFLSWIVRCYLSFFFLWISQYSMKSSNFFILNNILYCFLQNCESLSAVIKNIYIFIASEPEKKLLIKIELSECQ